jgi:hypothetical protein
LSLLLIPASPIPPKQDYYTAGGIQKTGKKLGVIVDMALTAVKGSLRIALRTDRCPLAAQAV